MEAAGERRPSRGPGVPREEGRAARPGLPVRDHAPTAADAEAPRGHAHRQAALAAHEGDGGAGRRAGQRKVQAVRRLRRHQLELRRAGSLIAEGHHVQARTGAAQRHPGVGSADREPKWQLGSPIP